MSKTFFDYWKEGYTREQVRTMYGSDMKAKILFGGYYGFRDVVETEGISRHALKQMGLTKEDILAWHLPMLTYFVDNNPNVTIHEMVVILNDNNFLSRTQKTFNDSMLAQSGFSFIRKTHKRQMRTPEWDNIHSYFQQAVKNGCDTHQKITDYLNENAIKTPKGTVWKRSNFSMFVINHPQYDWTLIKTKEYRSEFIEQLKKDLQNLDLKNFISRLQLAEHLFEKYKDNKDFGFNITITFVSHSLMDLEVHIKKHESHKWQNWYADLKKEIQKYFRNYGWLPKLQLITLLNRNEFPNRDGNKWYVPSLYRLINNFGLDLDDLYTTVVVENIDFNKTLTENVDHLNQARLFTGRKKLWSEETLKEFISSHIQKEKEDSN